MPDRKYEKETPEPETEELLASLKAKLSNDSFNNPDITMRRAGPVEVAADPLKSLPYIEIFQELTRRIKKMDDLSLFDLSVSIDRSVCAAGFIGATVALGLMNLSRDIGAREEELKR